jgi:ADP-heptose:LPS heptosyltransferase
VTISKRVKRGIGVEIKNGAASILIKCARACRPPSCARGNTILVVATTGLGDSLMMTPAIRALRQAYPEVRIELLVTPASKQVFVHLPYVDRLWILKKGWRALEQLRWALFACFRVTYVLHASNRMVWIIAALSSRRIIAGDWQPASIPSDWITDWYRTSPREHRIRSHAHTIQLGHPQARLIETHMEFRPSVEAMQTARIRYPDVMEAKHDVFVGIFPGAKDRFKCWPIERFIALGQWLHTRRVKVVVFGGPEDESLIVQFKTACPEARVVSDSLDMMATLMQRLRFFVTNDSGPMHLAEAMKVPTISLFAPTDSEETGLLSEQSSTMTIQKPVTCFPSKDFPIIETQCYNKACRNPICLQQISVSEVVQLIEMGLTRDRMPCES